MKMSRKQIYGHVYTYFKVYLLSPVLRPKQRLCTLNTINEAKFLHQSFTVIKFTYTHHIQVLYTRYWYSEHIMLRTKKNSMFGRIC